MKNDNLSSPIKNGVRSAITGGARSSICPICESVLAPGPVAVTSHLRIHIRAKQITEQERRDIVNGMFPATAERIKQRTKESYEEQDNDKVG